MNAEESVWSKALFKFLQRNSRQETIIFRVDAGVIVFCLNKANLINRNKNLAPALNDRNSLNGCHRRLRAQALLNLIKSLLKALGLNGLHQVIYRVNTKCIQCILTICGDKHNLGRILQLVKSLCKLHSICLRHGDIEEQDLNARLHEFLDSIPCTCGLNDFLETSGLLKQELEFRTGWSLVINNHGTHVIHLPTA